jgi:hypothetical protein
MKSQLREVIIGGGMMSAGFPNGDERWSGDGGSIFSEATI